MAAERCPQCGARLPASERQGDGASLQTCEYCSAVVVSGRVVGRDLRKNDATKWSEAICCRLCGGALSSEQVAQADKARCGFCGHAARMRPGLLSVLRVLFRDPKLVPPPLKRSIWFCVSVMFLAIGLTAVGIASANGYEVVYRTTIDLQGPAIGPVLETEFEVPHYSKRLEVRLERGALERGRADLRIISRQIAAKGCHEQRMAVASAEMRMRRETYNRGFVGPAVGRYQLQVLVTKLDDAKGSFEMRVYVNRAFSLGYIILLFNLLLWFSFAAIRLRVDYSSTKRGPALFLQVLTLIFLATWALVTVGHYDPLAKTEMEDKCYRARAN